MKRLDEILSKTKNSASSEASSISPTAADDAIPDAACPICGGAGFVRRARPVDDPRFGKAEPCDCVLQEAEDVRKGRLERISNLGALTRFTFESFSPGGHHGESDALAAAVENARAYAADASGWLVLTGPSGCGKTHLAAAIANERIALGQPALFMVVPDLLDHLRASQDPANDELGYHQLFEQVRNTPFLVLDDIDATSGTPWGREKLYQVVNHRYNTELPTVFTTTTPVRQLDDRLASRLSNPEVSRVVALQGPASSGYQQVGGMTRERLAEHTFRDFEVRSSGLRAEDRDSLEAALSASRAFAEDPSGWFLLVGGNGCGKTHLACAIANRCLGNGRSVFFAVVPDLLDHLRASFAPGNDMPYDELFDSIRNADVLVLDDYGAQQSTPWAQEKLYQVVNYRTVAGLPTVVTSDRPIDELQAAQPRILARMLDPQTGTLIYISAPHFRLGRINPPEQRSPRARR